MTAGKEGPGGRTQKWQFQGRLGREKKTLQAVGPAGTGAWTGKLC